MLCWCVVLCCAVPCRAVLCCAVMCCIGLDWIVLCCVVLCCVVMRCAEYMLWCVTVMLCDTSCIVLWSTVPCGAVGQCCFIFLVMSVLCRVVRRCEVRVRVCVVLCSYYVLFCFIRLIVLYVYYVVLYGFLSLELIFAALSLSIPTAKMNCHSNQYTRYILPFQPQKVIQDCGQRHQQQQSNPVN